MIARLRTKKSYFIVALISILTVSIGLNMYDSLYARPVMQTRIDYMSAEAFQSWFDELKGLKIILEPASTDLDVREAMSHTFAARRFATILEWQIEISRPPNFAEHLYLHVSGATYMLDKAVSAIATKPPVTSRHLDDNTLQEIGNLTRTIENLESSVETVDRGVDPVQQLEEKGVLTQVINSLRQIETTSAGIWERYGFYES